LRRVNNDTIVAILLLVLCAVFFKVSFDIRDLGYESMGAEVWPRIVLAALFIMSSVYLVQSLREGNTAAPTKDPQERSGIKGFLYRYQNAIYCHAAFFLFLLTLDYLGMLLGGIMFVFLTLTALGNRKISDHIRHALIAVLSIGMMWSIFTFGLKVFLPEGEILKVW
jgi:putative tricarboxylic transport membrane protein